MRRRQHSYHVYSDPCHPYSSSPHQHLANTHHLSTWLPTCVSIQRTVQDQPCRFRWSSSSRFSNTARSTSGLADDSEDEENSDHENDDGHNQDEDNDEDDDSGEDFADEEYRQAQDRVMTPQWMAASKSATIDICNIRLVCRQFEQASIATFGTLIGDRPFRFTDSGMRNLREISVVDVLSPWITDF